MTRTWLKRLAPIAFYALLVIFLYIYLRSIDFDKFQHAHFVWGYIGLASLLGLIGRYWQVFIWLVLLTSLGATDLTRHTAQLTYVYAKSWLGRYIPGTAPWILGKIYFASQHGISKQKLAVSSLLEGGLQITVTMAVAAIMLLLDSRLDVIEGSTKLLIGVVLLGCIIAVLPPVFNRLISVAYRLLRHKTLAMEHLATNGTVTKGVLLYTVGALLNGLSLFFVAKAVDPSLSYHNIWFVMAAGNLSAAASMLAIFAPSGLGVREGIQLVLLSVIMPTELALLVVVATRLWSVLLDFVFFGFSRVYQLAARH
jgi:uncharacterized membrane protein YbhN (UPF0104 family)